MIASSLLSIAFAALITLTFVHGSAIHAASLISARKVDGINNRGSSKCGRRDSEHMQQIQTAVDKIEPGTIFCGGEQLACASYDVGIEHGAICAFLCNNAETAVKTIQKSYKDDDAQRNEWSPVNKTTFGDIVGDLRYIGATGCGTAPLIRGVNATEETQNRNDLGCITINYVNDPCGMPAGQLCKIRNLSDEPVDCKIG